MPPAAMSPQAPTSALAAAPEPIPLDILFEDEHLLVVHKPHGMLVHPSVRERTGKILLVEDDPLVREVVKACLQKFRKDVYVAQDGEEGLRIFKRYAADWSLVVSDITMPKMTGIDASPFSSIPPTTKCAPRESASLNRGRS